MITFDICNHCKNYIGFKEGTRIMCCKAFPEGIPSEFDGSEIECNNGIKYERDPEIAEKFGV